MAAKHMKLLVILNTTRCIWWPSWIILVI